MNKMSNKDADIIEKLKLACICNGSSSKYLVSGSASLSSANETQAQAQAKKTLDFNSIDSLDGRQLKGIADLSNAIILDKLSNINYSLQCILWKDIFIYFIFF